MASEEEISQLANLLEEMQKVDKGKLLRPSLGEASLERDFAPRLMEIERKCQFALDFAADVHGNFFHPILASFNTIKSVMEQQADFEDADYVRERSNFLTRIDEHLEELKEFWPPVVAAAIQSRGLLEDEGVKRESERAIQSIEKESKSAIQQVRNEIKTTIDEAQARAEEIENRARLTASGISVEEAQKQFREAQGGLNLRVKIWGGIGIIFIAGFICAAWHFATADLPDQWRWEVIYYSAVRVSILAAIGTVAAFCLRIFRAHMHMSEKNRHRQRVANSIGAFVESAVTPEQRDQILSQLVESVIQFGNSGLLQREDDNVYRPKMTMDSIMRTLSSSSGKQQT